MGLAPKLVLSIEPDTDFETMNILCCISYPMHDLGMDQSLHFMPYLINEFEAITPALPEIDLQ